jgi:hypothetical protein
MLTALKRLLPLFALFSVALASGDARAVSLVWHSPSQAPLELRLAVALGPSRTTLRSQLRVSESPPGPLAIVVPAPHGASLDLASEAWLEALVTATAPRIASPKGVVASCPDDEPLESRVAIAGVVAHKTPAHPLEVHVLSDADAVASFAAKNDLALDAELVAALEALAPTQFLVVRISSPGSELITPTLRISDDRAVPVRARPLATSNPPPQLGDSC